MTTAKIFIMLAAGCILLAAGAAATRPSDVLPGADLTPYHWSEAEADDSLLAAELSSAFASAPIPPEVEARMRGKSYPEGCRIPISDLRYLIIPHYDGHGRVRLGEMVCHRNVAAELLDIFRELFQARYPIERMTLIDDYEADDQKSMTANNSSCFCYRTVNGSRKLSRHSRGMAVDINPLYNPYVRQGARDTIILPEAGSRWTDRADTANPYPVKRGDAAWRAFTSRGWRWGGNWRTRKDYQHFQK